MHFYTYSVCKCMCWINTIDNIVLLLMNNHKIIASTWHINNISINRIIERYKKKGKKDKIKHKIWKMSDFLEIIWKQVPASNAEQSKCKYIKALSIIFIVVSMIAHVYADCWCITIEYFMWFHLMFVARILTILHHIYWSGSNSNNNKWMYARRITTKYCYFAKFFF